MSTNDKRLAADISACQSAPDLQQQLRDRDRAMEVIAAENATLKAASDRQRQFILNGVEFGYIRLPEQPDTAIATHAQCLEGIKTPATEAFINAVRAEGLDIAAAEVDQWIGCDLLAIELRKKAEKLRSGEPS